MSQQKSLIKLKQIDLEHIIKGNAGDTAIGPDGIIIDFLAVDGAISGEASARLAADTSLSGDLTTESQTSRAAEQANASAIATETTNRMAADAHEAGVSADDRALIRSDLADYELSNDAALAAEVTRALGVEGTLNTAIGQEAGARIAADTAIRSEFAAADAEEALITISLIAEAVEAQAIVDAAQDTFTGEMGMDLAAQIAKEAAYEVSNDAALAAEAATARAAEVANATAAALASSDLADYEASNDIALAAQVAKQASDELARTAAITAAKVAADALLVSAKATADAKVEVEEGRIDAILLASSADKDSFAEIVTFINAVDLSNDNALAVVIGNLNTEIAATNADITAAATARGVIQSDVDANEAASVVSFASAATDRAAVRSEFAAADTTMRGGFAGSMKDLDDSLVSLSTQHDDDMASEGLANETARGVIQADVDQNEADADASFVAAATDRALVRSEFAAADTAAAAALATEISNRMAADTHEKNFSIAARAAIQADVDANELAADNAFIAMDQAYKTADTILGQEIGTEEAARIAGDAALTAAIAALAASAAAAQASTRVFNFYKEVKVEAVNDVSGGENEMMIFQIPGAQPHPSPTPGKEKMVMGVYKTYSEWEVNSSPDFSKIQLFLNGVMLQGGMLLNADDYKIFTGPNPATDPMEIWFSEGLLEEGDVLQVYASFL